MITLVFESTYFVMKAEKSLKQNSVKHNIIPTPRDINSDCGVAIKIADNLKDRAVEVLKEANIKFKVI